MNGKGLGAGVVLAGLVFVGMSAEGADLGRPNLVARAYLTTSVRDADWQSAIAETNAILDHAGVDLAWTRCSLSDGMVTRCAQPMKANEVAVRVVRSRAPRESRWQQPLGESLLDESCGCGALATIYLDHVESLARTSGSAAGTLLGRAIAHELGHLLLGPATHSQRGLMRATWTRDEVVRNRVVDWLFPPDDARRLRLAFERRRQPEPDTVIVWSTH